MSFRKLSTSLHFQYPPNAANAFRWSDMKSFCLILAHYKSPYFYETHSFFWAFHIFFCLPSTIRKKASFMNFFIQNHQTFLFCAFFLILLSHHKVFIFFFFFLLFVAIVFSSFIQSAPAPCSSSSPQCHFPYYIDFFLFLIHMESFKAINSTLNVKNHKEGTAWKWIENNERKKKKLWI